MKLVSMKNKPKKTLRGTLKAAEAPISVDDEELYPWGLQIDMNDDSIKKLGIDIENISAGDSVYFVAKARVTRVSDSENIDSKGKKDSDRSIGMRIEKMSWGKADTGFK